MPLLRNRNMTCGQCAHFDQYPDSAMGNCSEGPEVLIFEGMPRGEFVVREYQSAESCPHFDESVTSMLNNAPMPGWDERVDVAYRQKVEGA